MRMFRLAMVKLKSAEKSMKRYRRSIAPLAIATIGMLAVAGCHTDMWVQPKPKPQAESDFWPDGMSSRPPIPHAVDRDHLKTDDAYWRGIRGVNVVKGKPAGAIFVDDLPDQLYNQPEFRSVTGDKSESLAKILDRGQDRFNIFCSPCHGELGDGQGMIAQRGFSLKVPPRNYHTDRLRSMPLGHFFDVITNGDGAMTPRAFQVEPDDRWAIAAYIRVLQKSQHADVADLRPDEVSKIDAPPQAAPTEKSASGAGSEKSTE